MKKTDLFLWHNRCNSIRKNTSIVDMLVKYAIIITSCTTTRDIRLLRSGSKPRSSAPTTYLWSGRLRYWGVWQMEYTLGLDIGIASVGWAVLSNDAKGEPCHIEDLGVRIFEAAEQPKTGASLAAPRREARNARRRIRRRRHRKERIKALLVKCEVITEEQLESLFFNSGFEKDVYTLRAEGLDRALNSEEWVRVLLHLTQRRGYQSNSTAEAAKDENTGVLRQVLLSNQSLMEEHRYRTVGEMFCKDAKFQVTGPDGKIWRKTRNSAGDYSFTVTRDMIRKEVTALFQSQREFGNPFAKEAFETAYTEILFSQRHFDEGPGGDSPYQKGDLRGNCTFEPDERRAFKACYTFEYFKLLQDLNHIRILSPKESTRELTQEERQKLIALALKSSGLDYSKVRKALALPQEASFNVVRYGNVAQEEAEKKSKFQQMQSYHKLRKSLDGVQKNAILQLGQDQLDEIATILSLYKGDDKRRFALETLKLSSEMISALLPLSFSKAGNLSLKAMKKLIPHLEQGETYDTACRAVYGDHRGHFGGQRHKTLTLNRELRESGALDAITNPVVLRALSQTTKVLNAIIRKYGSPQCISIELAREMRKTFEERRKLEKQYEENRSKNEKIMAQIEEIKGERPTGLDLVKFKLFQEQNEICLYSGTKLDAARLFEPGYVDVDHIIPYSISFDDSYRNKALVLASENRQKGNRLPLEYLSQDPQRVEAFITLVERNIRDYRKCQKLLKRGFSEEEEREFKRRSLVDTQYITRAIFNLLNDYLEFSPCAPKKPVRAVNGAVTDYIRKRLGLEKNRADGDLHHAMDAAVVAITTDGMIQRVSNYSKRREWGKKVVGQYADPETGELLSRDAFDEKYAPTFPEPWSGFREELLARLSPDPDTEIRALGLPGYDSQAAIRPVFVSRMPRRKVTGAAHKETIRSGKVPGHAVSKIPLTGLKLDQKGEIAGYYNQNDDPLLYSALKARLHAFGGDAKQAFAQPFYKPKKDGTPGPIVNKVKIQEKTSLHVAACGGIADNGGMVRIDVYYVPGDGYYLIPVYTSDVVKRVLPQKAVAAGKSHSQWPTMNDEYFIFTLYPGDLIRIESKKPINFKLKNKTATGEPELLRKEWLVYYVGADISTGAITVTTHDRKYRRSGLGIKTLLFLEKYEVDPLGIYHKVRLPEKRQGF